MSTYERLFYNTKSKRWTRKWFEIDEAGLEAEVEIPPDIAAEADSAANDDPTVEADSGWF